jgi:hypothetical protein
MLKGNAKRKHQDEVQKVSKSATNNKDKTRSVRTFEEETKALKDINNP